MRFDVFSLQGLLTNSMCYFIVILLIIRADFTFLPILVFDDSCCFWRYFTEIN